VLCYIYVDSREEEPVGPTVEVIPTSLR
jgi:hypothetical protein